MARWQFRPPVERVKQGYRVHLDDDERQLVAGLLAEFRTLITERPDEPALRRIFPAAYHRNDDAELDAEYRRLMHDELVASRLAGIELVEATLAERGVVDEARVLALAQALNGVRLVLGTVLDVTEDDGGDDVMPDHPRAAEHQLYHFLSWLLEWTVRALSQGT